MIGRKRSIVHCWATAALVILLIYAADTVAQNSSRRGRSTAQTESAVGGPASASKADVVLREAYEHSRRAKTEEELTQIIDLCQQALDQQPSQPSEAYARQLMAWSYNKRGEAIAAAGREQEALADFEEAVRLSPDRWQAIHNRAVSYAVLGRYQEALADLDRTIALRPSFAKAYYNRAELRYDSGDFAAAIRDYDQVIRFAPRDAQAYVSRGHAYYRQRNMRAAMRDFSQAIRLDSQNAEAHTHRGDAYGDLGYYNQAANDYRAAIRINPEFGRAYQSAAWLMATCADERFRNPQLAVEAARKAIELDGENNYRYPETLAAALANAGQFEEAQKVQARVVEMAPQDVIQRQRERLALYAAGKPYRDVKQDEGRGTRD